MEPNQQTNEKNRIRDLEIKNKVTLTRRKGEGDNGEEGKGLTEEHKLRTLGHGQWGGLTVGLEGDGVGESTGEKGGTTVTEQQ